MIPHPSMASAQGRSFFPVPTESRILSQLQHGIAIDQIIKSVSNFDFSIVHYFNLSIYQEILHSFLKTCLFFNLSISRIFVHAKNNFNQIKENFLDFQRRNNSSVSPSQGIVCTCPFTGFDQAFYLQVNVCPYLQERATKSLIL